MHILTTHLLQLRIQFAFSPYRLSECQVEYGVLNHRIGLTIIPSVLRA